MRDLHPTELALIEALEDSLEVLQRQADALINLHTKHRVMAERYPKELARFDAADPIGWATRGQALIAQGSAALIRSVLQP